MLVDQSSDLFNYFPVLCMSCMYFLVQYLLTINFVCINCVFVYNEIQYLFILIKIFKI